MMPLSEFYRMAKGNLQNTTTCSTDLSYLPGNDFVELVWENGPIMVQGQSSRVRKSPIYNTLPSVTPKHREKDLVSGTSSKSVKFGAVGSVSNDIPILGSSGETGLGRDDETVPWLNYPVDDTLQHDYCHELLAELSGVTVDEFSMQNNLTSIEKRNGHDKTMNDSQNVSSNGAGLEPGNESMVSSSRANELAGSRVSGIPGISSNNAINTHQAVCGNSIQGQTSETVFPTTKKQKIDSGLRSSNSGFLNFSQFLRPAGLVSASLQKMGPTSAPGSPVIKRMGNEHNQSAPSTFSRKEIGFHDQSYMVAATVDSQPLVAKPQSRTAEKSEAVCQENAPKDDESRDQAPGESPRKGMPDGENTIEPILASSSVCSGNGVERASNDPTHNLKRRCRESDDSEYQSEDVEEESVGVRKAAPARGTGSRKSKAAEVHNLSERRRRDRINEKMRSLQELIPNCNKVDKASMLEEAIEYLKMLQLQVQMMSMGTGLYMPPMMLPAGMQHVHPGQMSHFSPMGVGMGMRIGMGMGYDMGMIQVPHMQATQFAGQPISCSNNFRGLANANLQAYGSPGRGLPMLIPRPPFVPFSARPPMPSPMGATASSRVAVPGKVPISASISSSKDLLQNANSQMMHNADASRSMHQMSTQVVTDIQD